MKWRLFICSDCDTDEGAVIVPVPDDADPDRPSGIEFCPGCGNYLSMCSAGNVEVSGVPASTTTTATAVVSEKNA